MTCGEELLALLIPLHEDFMLLPNAAVAEVIGYREAEPLAHTPDWLAGEIQWRREPTPVIRFERLAGLPAGPPGHRARICMVNTLTPESRIPYFGVIAQGIPRLVRIGGGNTEPLARDGVGGVIRQWLRVGDEEAMVPDLDAIERLLLENVAEPVG